MKFISLNKIIVIFLLINLLIFPKLFSQNQQKKNLINPTTTTIASAIIPGSGQILNHQWWKTPVIYAGLGTCIYFVQFNRTNYLEFRDAYILRTDNNPLTIDKFDPVNGTALERYEKASQLKSIRDYYRRNLELSLLVTAAVYTLNIIDAYVYAHLKSFKELEDISINLNPSFGSDHKFILYSGITFKF